MISDRTEIRPDVLDVLESEPPYDLIEEPALPRPSVYVESSWWLIRAIGWWKHDKNYRLYLRKLAYTREYNARSIKFHVYAVTLALSGSLAPGKLVQVAQTGETMLVLADGTLNRSWGAVEKSLIVAGYQIVVLGDAYQDGAS